MNRIKRLLEQLEREAALHAQREAGRFESSQRDLCCPLPETATAAEVAEALRLLTAGKAALPDPKPLLKFRDFAIGLHRKYSGPFAAEALSDA